MGVVGKSELTWKRVRGETFMKWTAHFSAINDLLPARSSGFSGWVCPPSQRSMAPGCAAR